MARNGSFDFAKGFTLCVAAKANTAKSGQVVPFVGRQKNLKIFVWWCICLLKSFFISSLMFHFHCQFAVSLSFLRLRTTFTGIHSCRSRLLTFRLPQKINKGTDLCNPSDRQLRIRVVVGSFYFFSLNKIFVTSSIALCLYMLGVPVGNMPVTLYLSSCFLLRKLYAEYSGSSLIPFSLITL